MASDETLLELNSHRCGNICAALVGHDWHSEPLGLQSIFRCARRRAFGAGARVAHNPAGFARFDSLSSTSRRHLAPFGARTIVQFKTSRRAFRRPTERPDLCPYSSITYIIISIFQLFHRISPLIGRSLWSCHRSLILLEENCFIGI
jgi:hypothetical protein